MTMATSLALMVSWQWAVVMWLDDVAKVMLGWIRLTLKDPGRQQRAVLVITSVGWSWFRPQYLCRLHSPLSTRHCPQCRSNGSF